MLVSAEHLYKMQNIRKIVEDVSFAIEEKDRIALVGINGTGKSTLLRVIAGKEKADAGTITYRRDLRISMLDQDPHFQAGTTILQEVLASARDVNEYEARAILERLGMHDMSAKCDVLSGGQKKRVALARALLRPCDLLILDEPTNHLDAMMIEWLEKYLQKRTSALLMVTHDRYFMERICTKMLELSHARIYTYEANYSAYLAAKEERLQLAQSKEAKRRSLLRKELEWVRAGVQARTTKSRARLERFAQLSETQHEKADETLDLNLRSARLGRKTIECVNLSKRYGSHLLFADFSLQLKRSDRIGIIGENGCGKTTLLKIMAKEEQPDSGEVIHGETVKIGFFHQGHEQMDHSMRVIDYIREVSDQIETAQGRRSAAQMLEQFLFDKDLQYNTIGRLSGGEKRRLYLLRVLMGAPNVLFLDEPTTDLDITTLTILEDYLDQFPGIIVTVSHDRYFLDRICDSLLIFHDQRIERRIGGYSVNDLQIRSVSAPPEKEREKPRHAAPKMSTREKQELEHMEEDIAALEGQIAQLDEAMGNCEDFRKIEELSAQRDALVQRLEMKMERWMTLSELKAQVDEYYRKA